MESLRNVAVTIVVQTNKATTTEKLERELMEQQDDFNARVLRTLQQMQAR